MTTLGIKRFKLVRGSKYPVANPECFLGIEDVEQLIALSVRRFSRTNIEIPIGLKRVRVDELRA